MESIFSNKTFHAVIFFILTALFIVFVFFPSLKKIDEEVKHLFEKQNFMSSYNKYFGTPLILGLHLRKI